MVLTKEQLSTLENWSRSLLVKALAAIVGLIGVGLAAYLPKEPLTRGLLLACAGLLVLATWLALLYLRTRLDLESARAELSKALEGPKEPSLSEAEVSILCSIVDDPVSSSSRKLAQKFHLNQDDVDEALERLVKLSLIEQSTDIANLVMIDGYGSTRSGRKYVRTIRANP